MENNREPPPRPPQTYSTKGHRHTEQSDSQHNLVRIKQFHDEAYLYVEQGLNCDEQGQKEQAVTLYTKGLRCIDLALDIPHETAECSGPDWQKAKNLIQKMKRSKQQIQGHVQKLLATDAGAARGIDDPPPSYEEATTPNQSDFDMCLEASLLRDDVNGEESMAASADELFRIPDGVQIFYITKEGYVSAPSYPSALGIYKFRDRLTGPGSMEVAQVFLRVGDWSYPLLVGQSPVLHANWGAYIFPDITASADGNAVGVIIPDSVSPTERARFERTLNSYTAMRDQEQSPSAEEISIASSGITLPVAPPGEASGVPLSEERTSTKISRGLETAAEWISWGMVKGAEKTGDLLKKGSNKLQESLRPEDQERVIDPRAQKGLYYTRRATEGFVTVSSFLVRKLGQGTVYLARKAAPHVKQQGEKIMPKSLTSKDGSGQSKLEGVMEVAAGGLKSWATVYVGLEQSAKVLAKNLADETVHVVQHKYGSAAGELTENTLYSGANVALGSYYAASFGPTAIAKRAAKDTGQAVVDDFSMSNCDNRPSLQQNRPNMDCGDKSTELRDS